MVFGQPFTLYGCSASTFGDSYWASAMVRQCDLPLRRAQIHCRTRGQCSTQLVLYWYRDSGYLSLLLVDCTTLYIIGAQTREIYTFLYNASSCILCKFVHIHNRVYSSSCMDSPTAVQCCTQSCLYMFVHRLASIEKVVRREPENWPTNRLLTLCPESRVVFRICV